MQFFPRSEGWQVEKKHTSTHS